jgi:peptidoglycan/xylan/chitin deacetylase (PgdA/CDA1 family)
MLHDLAADGHAIEFHGTEHLDARRYVADHGLDAYLADEIDPGLAAMRADGFDPHVFAYPFGAHTAATDRALLDRFTLLRTVRTTCPR